MFLVPVKTLLVDAVRQTFDAEHPEADFRGVSVGIDFPTEREDYPAIWVDFSPSAQLESAGINHREYEGDSTGFRTFTRWRFQGTATFTVVALTSLERDRLFDEMVRIMAFGLERAETSDFRAMIESNEYIAINFDFDQIVVQGLPTTPGTPWGTEEFIYEANVAMEAIGEFVSDGSSQTLVPLTEIQVYEYRTNQPDPLPTGEWS